MTYTLLGADGRPYGSPDDQGAVGRVAESGQSSSAVDGQDRSGGERAGWGRTGRRARCRRPRRPARPGARRRCRGTAVRGWPGCIEAHSGDLTTPGQTALTRMGASSTASARGQQSSTAPQMLAATAQPGLAAPGDAAGQGDRPAGLHLSTAARTAPSAPKQRQGEELPGLVQVERFQVHQRQRLARCVHKVVDVAEVVESPADLGRIGEVGCPPAGAGRQLRQGPVNAGWLPGDDRDLRAAARGGLRCRQADAGRATEDDDPLTPQIRNVLLLCCAGVHVFHGALFARLRPRLVRAHHRPGGIRDGEVHG